MSTYTSDKFYHANIDGIQKDELKALRDADHISFRFSTDFGHQIIAMKEVQIDGFDGGTVERRIQVGGNFDGGRDRFVTSAVHVSNLVKYDEIIGSIFEILQPGDKIAFIWRMGNTSQLLDSKDLDRHELKIRIDRTSKAGKTKRLVFKVAEQVTVKDYAYGMIRSM